jgi:S1-C subfamily serine protease
MALRSSLGTPRRSRSFTTLPVHDAARSRLGPGGPPGAAGVEGLGSSPYIGVAIDLHRVVVDDQGRGSLGATPDHPRVVAGAVHVVDRMGRRVYVQLPDGLVVVARVVAFDARLDVALLTA